MAALRAPCRDLGTFGPGVGTIATAGRMPLGATVGTKAAIAAWPPPLEEIVMAPATEHHPPVAWRAFGQDASVARRFAAVRSYLSAAPGRLLGDSRAAGPDLTEGRTGLHVRRAGLDVSREVQVVLGDLEMEGHSMRIPVRWADARRPRFFPVLEATLEITPAGPDSGPATRLALSGRYVPPLGRLGVVADTLAGHRVVLESVDRFLGDLVERLERDLPPEPARAAVTPPEPAQDSIPRRRVFFSVEAPVWQAGGVAAIERRLRDEPGVIDVVLDANAGLLVVEYDAATCGLAHLATLADPLPNS